MADLTVQRIGSTSEQEHPEPVAAASTEQLPQDDLVLEELLVEDVSIDGMCGVY